MHPLENRCQCTLFQSTPLAGGATPASNTQNRYLFEFQSTPLAGGATFIAHLTLVFAWNFNPRPSREGRQDGKRSACLIFDISIHAPRGRGDRQVCISAPCGYISIHAPRGRGDKKKQIVTRNVTEFQSTPLAGGATGVTLMWRRCSSHFNPRPSREGRRIQNQPFPV